MKKEAAFMLAALTLLTGCGSSPVSGSDSTTAPESSDVPEEHKDDTVITIASVHGIWEPMQKLIDEFNARDNGIRVEVKNYAEEEDLKDFGIDENGVFNGYDTDELKTIDFRVTQDLLNKDTIDLVGPFSFGNGAKYEIFKQRGGFCDLYEFMKDDPEVNPDTLSEHILELNERDGKLYSMPTYYAAWSMTGKSGYVGSERNWTVSEFIDRWEKMPEGATVNGTSNAENIYYDVLRTNTTAFVDYANCEVHFDSPDFRKMLEFCSTFPSNMGQKSEHDYNDVRFVQVAPIFNYKSAIASEMNYAEHKPEYYRLRDGSHTLVGFPTSDRRGAYLCSTHLELSICANISAEKQQAAWKFLRELYTEQFQTDSFAKRIESRNPQTGETSVQYELLLGFPINNAARANIAEGFINGSYENTNTIIPEDEYAQGSELRLEQADIDFIDEYISSIDRWEFQSTDRELFSIVEDEVLAYLHGEQDIDSTIDLIQNRASIWISEQS